MHKVALVMQIAKCFFFLAFLNVNALTYKYKLSLSLSVSLSLILIRLILQSLNSPTNATLES